MIRTVIYGCNGKMGQVLGGLLLEQEGFQVVAGIDRYVKEASDYYPVFSDPNDYKGEVDVIIDFSNPSNLEDLLEFAISKNAALVVATTGYKADQMEALKSAGEQIPVLHASNMSLGVNVVSKLLSQISSLLEDDYDIEIIEKHHNKKVDAPSGTALLLARKINEALKEPKELVYGRVGGDSKREKSEIGIHAVRGGTIPGEHTVIFAGMDEIIEIKHTALSKGIFAKGAIRAAQFLHEKPKGFYTIDDIFKESAKI